MTTGPRNLKPCGTDAAYKRHQRHGEKPCTECTEANRRRVADAQGFNALYGSNDRPVLPNGLPEVPFYRYRARTYPWAKRVLAWSEARYGKPDEEEAA